MPSGQNNFNDTEAYFGLYYHQQIQKSATYFVQALHLYYW